MKENRDQIEIDLKRMFVVLLTRAWLIILVGVIFATAAFCYAKFAVTPTYSASVQMYVNNNYPESPGYSSSQLTAAQELADTYMVIIRSRDMLTKVQEDTGLGYSVSALKGMVTTASVNDTEIFQVTVTCNNFQHAAMIADSISRILPEHSLTVIEYCSVTVVESAQENPNKVAPSLSKYALIGAVVGCFLMAVVVVVLELADTTIHSEEYLAAVYKDYPLLAVVPGAESSKSGYYKGYYRGYYAEKKPDNKPEKKHKKNGGVQ